MSFILKCNGQRVGLRYIKSVIDGIGLKRFLELNSWAVDLAIVRDTRKKEDERLIQTAKPQRLPEDDLYAPLRTMYKFGKKKQRWY